MTILGIETSCDETACAILKKENNRITILSNVLSSSASLQAKYGGIIPEQAAREQIKSIIPVIEEALEQAQSTRGVESIHPAGFIDAIAITYGPGLIGSLLVGVETAKTLATVWNKPLIPVNHLIGHFYANWITTRDSFTRNSLTSKLVDEQARDDPPEFPCLGLLVSGGHTDLVIFRNHGKYEYLGGTRDDAAGECFDKCARLLGLPYPGGPQISKLAQKGDPNKFKLPIPLREKGDFSAKGGPAYGWDFSYSGLKTAVANIVHASPVILSAAKNLSRMRDSNESRDPPLIVQDDKTLADLAASIEDVIVKSLIEKVVKAIQIYKVEQVMIAGGVAANQKLKQSLESRVKSLGSDIKLHIPSPELCTDNAAMIAAAAFFQKPIFRRKTVPRFIKNPLNIQAEPNLSL